MIGRKLSVAAKQVLSSSSTQISFFHASHTAQHSLKRGLLSSQKRVSANRSLRNSSRSSSAAGAPAASRKMPPRALVGEHENPSLQRSKDGDDEEKSRPRSLWRPPWQVTEDNEGVKKLKEKEWAPSGPIEFESPRSSWQPPSHVAEDNDKVKKKKEKKKAPPGPIEFESLTSTTPVHSDLPFAFRHSYTEIPKVSAVGFQEKFSPFGPGRLDRIWDGQQAVPLSRSPSSSSPPTLTSSLASSDNSVLNMKKSKYSFKGIRLINPPSPQLSRTSPRRAMTRERVLGKPLTPEETKVLVENASKHKTRRQINMGRDGLTHNMLIEIQDYWKREPVCRIRCKGVCTVDMDNVHFQLEDKSGGKVIERVGGTLYLFRGRNFKYKERPIIPPMLWRPHAPLYPKLITEAPGGLNVHEANALRKRGLKIMRLCILSKNAYYGDLVRHVREAFEDDELVRIDCKGLNTSDYKKIGSKLRDLVPCYLLSFEKEQIILWKGRDKLSSNSDSTNSENAYGANVQLIEDGKEDIQMPVEALSIIKSSCDDVCEDIEKCLSDGNWSDDSDEAINLCDSLDESV